MRIAATAAFAAFALVATFAPTAHAETITLSNGDRITGKISDSDGKTLTLTTDYAGDVKVKWASIKELVADKPLFITTTDKKTIQGTVVPAEKMLQVHTATGATLLVSYDKIAAIRTADSETAFEKSQHPTWKQDWKGSGTVGLALARGNSETTNLNTAVAVERKTPYDDFGITESSIYTTDNAPGGGVTANAVLGSIHYNRNITDRFFLTGEGDFTHDELQDLTLRSIYTGGFGWHAIEHPNKTTLDLIGGVNYTRETYNGTAAIPAPSFDRDLAGLTFGDIFMHKFGSLTTFTESAYIYPELEDFSQYRVSVDANAVTKINKWLGWQITLSDRYVTNPPIAGTKSNDVILSTGINLAFGK
jgi:putative salt-induced outer membrane protein YdiY